MDIKDCRDEIDRIDVELQQLFEKRMQMAAEISRLKSQKSLSTVNAEREREILLRVDDRSTPDLHLYSRVLYTTLFDLSRSYQNRLRHPNGAVSEVVAKAVRNQGLPDRGQIACQGVEGAYSQQACDKLFALPAITYFRSFAGVAQAVEKGLCQYGVLPIENSSHGTVNDVYDLVRDHRFFIVRSLKLHIRHSLLAKPGATMADIREIVSQIKVAASNEKLDHPCIHMRFTGSPGTGKTTVARILGEILREEGILRKGAFFEYSARDLVAEYVGQTAVKTATICRDAYGSVLFIDEAYALYEGGDHNNNDYGREAITTLISEMENHRDDMLVVMAGYTDEMETLMKANPGIRSRMPCLLHFKNYTRRQLFDIFMLMVRKHFDYDPDLEEEALHYFEKLPEEYMVSKEFANARFVRNLYERTWSKGALRTSLSGSKTIVLTRQDFIAASGEKEFSEKLEAKKVLGFK